MSDFGQQALACDDPAQFLRLWLDRPLLQGEAQQTLERYYASFRQAFPRRMQGYYADQLREVTRLVETRPGQRLLEVGCGCGSESLWLALRGADVLGLDLRADRAATARARADLLSAATGRPLKLRFQTSNLLDLDPADGGFDIIWMEQAFHHLEPRQTVVAHLAALLRPGGWLVISEANGWNPLLQTQLFLQRGPRTVIRYTDEDGREHQYGNERVLSAMALSHLLSDVGIERQSIRHFRVFPNHPLFASLEALERGLARNWLAPLTTHYNYVGRKPGGTA